MNETVMRYLQIGEYFAAGFFEDPDKDNRYRFAKALLRYYENCPLPEYKGGKLYPSGALALRNTYTIYPQFSRTYNINYGALKSKDPELYEFTLENFPENQLPTIDWDGLPIYFGTGYTHTTPNYERILKEGLASYKERIKKAKNDSFREGELLAFEAIEFFYKRCVEYLESVGADGDLITALKRVPFSTPRNLYEAIVAWNFVFYIDFGDNVGNLEQGLMPYYNGEDVTELLREYFINVGSDDGWSCRIGPEETPLSKQIIQAAKGLSRPMVELCINGDTSDSLWECACKSIAQGNANPSLYHYDLYMKCMRERFPEIPEEDLQRFCGCGCTETMLQGISRVGSSDAYLNTLGIFSRYLRENLGKKATFEEFYQGYIDVFYQRTDVLIEEVNNFYKYRAECLPHPVRTILVDDCIDNETDFNAGGARWNWSIISFAGTINVVESMLAVRDLVYEKKAYTAQKFIKLLDEENEDFYLRLRKCPHYGVDDGRADALAADLLGKIFTSLDGKKSYFGQGFLSSSIQFITYVPQGKHVDATPDGRRKGEPLCDSMGAIMGNDTKSATALINSIAKLPLDRALGTPVVNLRLDKEYAEKMVRPLTEAFFEQGGMQLQINCLSAEELKDAVIHPEKHENLLVRTGGYIARFVDLSREMQQTVIKRTEHRG